MREIRAFNDWFYKDSFCGEDIQGKETEGFQAVTLPHTN